MQGMQGWRQPDPAGQADDCGHTAQPGMVGLASPLYNTSADTGSARASRPISISTNHPAPSGRSFLSNSYLSPVSAGGLAATPRSAAHPYYSMSAPLKSAGAPANPNKTPVLDSGELPVLSYPSGSPSNGLKQSPRRRKAPSFPRSVRGSGESVESMDYCQTPSVLRVPPSPRDPRSMMYGGTPLTASYTLPLGMPTSNIRGGGGDGSDGSLRQRRASSSTSRATAKLDGIPHTYVVKSLRKLAPQFWNKAETADCRILVPLRHEGQATPSPTTSLIAQMQSNQSPSTASQAVFSPSSLAPPAVPQSAKLSPTTSAFSPVSPGLLAPGERKILTYPLHSDYLTTQSTLLRSLFHDGTTPTERRSSEITPTNATGPSAASVAESSAETSKAEESPVKGKGARVIPTPAAAPTTIWLPLPDPGSFAAILHWMYWGDAAALDAALSKGTVSWQGIVKNIEYLGLDDSIKRVMGVWWRRWVKVAAGRKENERKQQKARESGRRSESVDAEGDTSMSEAGGNDDQEATGTDAETSNTPAADVVVKQEEADVAGQRGEDVDGDVAGLLRAL